MTETILWYIFILALGVAACYFLFRVAQNFRIGRILSQPTGKENLRFLNISVPILMLARKAQQTEFEKIKSSPSEASYYCRFPFSVVMVNSGSGFCKIDFSFKKVDPGPFTFIRAGVIRAKASMEYPEDKGVEIDLTRDEHRLLAGVGVKICFHSRETVMKMRREEKKKNKEKLADWITDEVL